MARRFNSNSTGVTLDQQIYQMACLHPGFKVKVHRRQRSIVWVGQIRPTPMSANYTVQIELMMGYRPKIRVLEPELKVREGASCLPHYYSENKSLCLHEVHEWNSHCFVAERIVPWTSLWLYFYEVWFATGSWEGGGTHPDKPEHQAA